MTQIGPSPISRCPSCATKERGQVLSFAKIRCVTQMIRGPEPQRPEPRGGIDDTDFIMLEPVAHLTRAE